MISGLVLTPGFAPLASPAVTVSKTQITIQAKKRIEVDTIAPTISILSPFCCPTSTRLESARRKLPELMSDCSRRVLLVQPSNQRAACDALPAWLNALQQAAQAYLFLRRVLPDVSSSEAFSSIASSPSGPCAPLQRRNLGLTPASLES